MLLGHSTYLKVKAGGDKSMSEKRESLEGAEGVVPQGPCDKAKAKLPESQSPAVEPHTRCYSACSATPPGADRSDFSVSYLRLVGRWRTTPLKEMNGTPKSHSTRSPHDGTRDRLRDASPRVTESP